MLPCKQVERDSSWSSGDKQLPQRPASGHSSYGFCTCLCVVSWGLCFVRRQLTLGSRRVSLQMGLGIDHSFDMNPGGSRVKHARCALVSTPRAPRVQLKWCWRGRGFGEPPPRKQTHGSSKIGSCSVSRRAKHAGWVRGTVQPCCFLGHHQLPQKRLHSLPDRRAER
jgi:hypothetical protein